MEEHTQKLAIELEKRVVRQRVAQADPADQNRAQDESAQSLLKIKLSPMRLPVAPTPTGKYYPHTAKVSLPTDRHQHPQDHHMEDLKPTHMWHHHRIHSHSKVVGCQVNN